MNTEVIEVVTFRLAPGVEDAAFLNEAEKVNTFLRGCDGFRRRRLSKSPDGLWLEHVEWHSMADAKKASDALMTVEELKPFLAAIDMKATEIRHDALMLQAD